MFHMFYLTFFLSFCCFGFEKFVEKKSIVNKVIYFKIWVVFNSFWNIIGYYLFPQIGSIHLQSRFVLGYDSLKWIYARRSMYSMLEKPPAIKIWHFSWVLHWSNNGSTESGYLPCNDGPESNLRLIRDYQWKAYSNSTYLENRTTTKITIFIWSL